MIYFFLQVFDLFFLKPAGIIYKLSSILRLSSYIPFL